MFFLTQIDPRAAVKGSRDPLGFQPVWTSFGRQVVGNLTTVTRSVKNFATLLLGLYFADQAISSGRFDEESRADLFIKFEQLAAYSRYAYSQADGESSEDPLGIRRVRRRYHESSGTLRISAEREHQILSNQKTYGLWGLYSIAARQSGLVDRSENRLTPAAEAFVESEYLPQLSYPGSRDGAEILGFLTRDSDFEPLRKHKRLGKALALALGPKVSPFERDYYSKTLVFGSEAGCNHTSGRQQQLWELIDEVNHERHFDWNDDFNLLELNEVTKRAREIDARPLASALDSIRSIEPVLAASHRLFGFLLRRNETSLDHVTSEVRETWGRGLDHIEPSRVAELRPRIADASLAPDSDERIVRLAESLSAGDYAGAIRTALDQNSEVMKDRGGAPWVSIERNKIKVRLREESGFLPEAEQLPALWVNSYFINSLKIIGHKVMGRRH